MIRGKPNRDVKGSLGRFIERVIGAGFSTDQVSAGCVGVGCNGNLICSGCTSNSIVEVGVAVAGIVEGIRRKSGRRREEVLRRSVLDGDAAALSHNDRAEKEDGKAAI